MTHAQTIELEDILKNPSLKENCEYTIEIRQDDMKEWSVKLIPYTDTIFLVYKIFAAIQVQDLKVGAFVSQHFPGCIVFI